MATVRVMLSHLRRYRPLPSLSHYHHHHHQHHLFLLSNPLPPRPPSILSPTHPHFSTSGVPHSFSTLPDSDLPLSDSGCYGGDDAILPVRALISSLDAYHDLSCFPWWIIIATSTVAMRVTLFPLLVLQLHKLKRISHFMPNLPPPFPPPLSGKSYIHQFSLFQKQRREVGCPSFLWFLAYFSVQVPCFFLWVTTIRKMSLDHHPGFDSGGILWFQNLTEFPHGVSGPIFPLLIAGLHYLNVQRSLEKSAVQKMTGVLGSLARYYKTYLNLLTLPLVYIGYCIPQGSLVYWVTNSSLSVIQQLFLKHPTVRTKLGLPDKDSSRVAANAEEVVAPATSTNSPKKGHKVPIENLSCKQLVAISTQLLSHGQKERAIPLLKLAIEKDPDYVNALIVMGQTLLQNEQYAEATEYLEQAVSKLLLAGYPTQSKDADLLILVSQWAGVACIRQGKNAEGIVHLERVGSLKEPEDPNSKVHYFNSLIFLGSALLNQDRKEEAIKYMRLVVAYNPAYKDLLQQCENDDGNFVSDLVSNKKGDH